MRIGRGVTLEHAPGVLVALLSSAFGVALVQGTGVLDGALRADPVTGSSSAVAMLTSLATPVFIVIAVYAGAVVTANTFSVIVAGRVRSIALRRLLGSTARAERRAVAREGLAVGTIGAMIGLPVGSIAVLAIVGGAQAGGVLGPFSYSFANPWAIAPAAGVALTTWLAATIGSRQVLTVTPMQALSGAVEQLSEQTGGSRTRSVAALVLSIAGGALLAGGIALGTVDLRGLLVSFAGGIMSFTGVVLGAHHIIPRALRVVGRTMGRSATTRLASENAIRYPERSTQSTIGLLIAVTLITTFGVATRTLGDMIESAARADPAYYAGVQTMLTTITVVFSVLTGFSAVIAGVGLVNSLSLSVMQRTRELGLLRALGFSKAQLRRMILAESSQLVLTATILGLLFGTVYGWAGAHAFIGAVPSAPGLAVIGIPWLLIAVVIGGAVLLTVVAFLAPSRRATRVAPVEALGVE